LTLHHNYYNDIGCRPSVAIQSLYVKHFAEGVALMWRISITLLTLAAACVSGKSTVGQESRRPYGPFDAIAEGAQNSELRRRSLIDSQLDAMDYLRSSIVPVAQPRALLGRADVAVYPYGRRGILGLRPRGYVVVRRVPINVNRGGYALEPPPPPAGYDYGTYAGQSVRQPIGHESLQTGPNRWEYRPLYADDDRSLDEAHGQIERDVQQEADMLRPRRQTVGTARRTLEPAASDPEELPVPRDEAIAREARPPVRGQARDIARSAAFSDEQTDRTTRRRAIGEDRRAVRTPPPPRPDPPSPPRTATDKQAPAVEDSELRGPLLQNPSTGTREF
jgi:hypothetical protein